MRHPLSNVVSDHGHDRRGTFDKANLTASGYHHTYFDNKGVKLDILSHIPTDAEIHIARNDTWSEASDLFGLIGPPPAQFYRAPGRSASPNKQAIHLPSIRSWYTADSDDEEEEDPMKMSLVRLLRWKSQLQQSFNTF